MKLNHELVRKLLLEVEEQESPGLDQTCLNDFVEKNTIIIQELIYIMKRLDEADYINMQIEYGDNEPYFYSINSITWSGHEFLDTIRDDKVWSKTKEIVSKFSSVSLTFIEKVASNVITQIITQSLNLS